MAPSMLVFGPQTTLPSRELASRIRADLLLDPRLYPLRTTIESLAELWPILVTSDKRLERVPAPTSLQRLSRWITHGEFPDLKEFSDPPATFVTPLTLILHVVLYISHLDEADLKHGDLLSSVKDQGGIQGYCTGLLSAAVVAHGGDVESIASNASATVRLAVAVGAYIELDLLDSDVTSLAVRSCVTQDRLEGYLKEFPGAYISVIADEFCQTLTVPTKTAENLSKALTHRGYTARSINLRGRFHHETHREVLKRLLALIESDNDFENHIDRTLSCPISLTGRPPITDALASILIERCDWYASCTAAFKKCNSHNNIKVVQIGLVDCIPTSLLRTFRTSVQKISDIPVPHANFGVPKCIKDVGTGRDPIAIIGMGCKFPGADSPEEFWRLLVEGTSMCRRMPEDRFKVSGLQRHPEGDLKYWGNFVNDIGAFDHRFFKKSSRESASMDPQQRLLLQVAYQTLETAEYTGLTGVKTSKDIGCFLGVCASDYADNVASHPPNAFSSLGTLRAFLSGRISHFFGWTGPSVTFDTACSSSAVAIQAACRALETGECSMALAGGANLLTSPNFYQNLAAASFLSPTGPSKPFDAQADGYCRGEGVGLVLLKPVSAAIRDNDNILGVIAAAAVNQSQNSTSITVPHSESQMDLYRKVLADAGMHPHDVSYVEAHGTGTPVGDPIEFASIGNVFGGSSRKGTLRVASLKGNIGHTESASGVASLIKTVLMLQHATIPMQANHITLNPKISPLELDNIVIPLATRPWTAKFKAACINNYGASGSNAAMIVHEAPAAPKRRPPALTKYPIYISANTSSSLHIYCTALLCLLEEEDDALLPSLAFRFANKHSRTFPHALITSVSSIPELRDCLLNVIQDSKLSLQADSSVEKPVVLVFGGQCSRYVGLSRRVYESCGILCTHLDECDRIIQSMGCMSLFSVVFQKEPISDLLLLHLALFSVQYACAMAWIDAGLVPAGLIGNRLGELPALAVSGVLSLKDGLNLVMIKCRELEASDGPQSEFTEPLLSRLEDCAQHLTLQRPKIPVEICQSMSSPHDINSSMVSRNAHPPVCFEEAVSRVANRLGPCTWLDTGTKSTFTERIYDVLGSSSQHSFQSIRLDGDDALESLANGTVGLWKSGYKVQFWPFHRSERASYPSLDIPPYQFEKTRHWLELKEPVTKGPEPGPPRSNNTAADILKYTGYSNDANQQAEFQVNTKHGKYSFFVEGHAVLGEPLCPAPLYIELACQAVGAVSPHIRTAEVVTGVGAVSPHIRTEVVTGVGAVSPHIRTAEVVTGVGAVSPHIRTAEVVTGVESLDIHAPLGLRDRTVSLRLHKEPSSKSRWKFCFSSQPTDGKGEAQNHATGTVIVSSDTTALAADFDRHGRSVSKERCQQLMADPRSQVLQGPILYQIFSKVATYADYYKGVQSVYASGKEIIGRVRLHQSAKELGSRKPLLLDAFLQVAGIHLNCLADTNANEVYVCTRLGRVQFSPGFDRMAGSPNALWTVYSSYRAVGDKGLVNDILVLDPDTHKVKILIDGAHFTKLTIPSLARVLSRANSSDKVPVQALPEKALVASKQCTPGTPSTSVPVRPYDLAIRLKATLSQVAEVPVADIHDNHPLEDLGIDSLLATEVLGEINKAFDVTISPSDFAPMNDVSSILKGLERRIEVTKSRHGVENDQLSAEPGNSDSEASTDSVTTALAVPELGHDPSIAPPAATATLNHAQEAFDHVRFGFDDFAAETGFSDFWKRVYPGQAKLVLGYTVEAFAALGCDLAAIEPGYPVPQIIYNPNHEALVQQLHNILRDGLLIATSGTGFVRTDQPLNTAPSSQVLQDIIAKAPQHASEHRLLDVIASRLAQCSTGTIDPLDLLFRSKPNRDLLGEVYLNGPMYAAASKLLGKFLEEAFFSHPPAAAFQVLELGGGTGGTTAHVVEHLTQCGIPFTYTFSDISSSFVSAAKKKFAGRDEMKYEVIDIEKDPTDALTGKFHAIISTNCIHATRSLEVSTRNIHRMLRLDGFTALVEFTHNMYWFDLVFGLLDGWWLFEDGRAHALASEQFWDASMRRAGFEHVSWTDGESLEARTLRIIAGFKSPLVDESFVPEKRPRDIESAVETVRYKKVDGVPLFADVYYPPTLPEKPMPIALMIHGGGHVMLSRKDIRRKQIAYLHSLGFLPLSIDYRLCPETTLINGPMRDVCDALDWVRTTLPSLSLLCREMQLDCSRVVVVGWSTGGHLAMTTAFTSIQCGIAPPDAILGLYCPTDFEDPFWSQPNYPQGTEGISDMEFNVLEGVQGHPITAYNLPNSSKATGGWMAPEDPRSRIILHMNWKGQALPVLLRGLLARDAVSEHAAEKLMSQPQPKIEQVWSVSPYAQIQNGVYRTPTFLVHGTEDDLIPYEQSVRTVEALKANGVRAEASVLQGKRHLFDLHRDPDGRNWEAVKRGYDFLAELVFGRT